MQIVEMKIDEVIPYEKNPRKNEAAVKYVANSIKEFGFKVPIVIDENNVIVAGHTRLKAAKKLKLETVPCVIADDLTEEQIKAFRLADNKVSEKAEWDFDLLGEELDDLLEDFNMEDFGFEFDDEEPEEKYADGEKGSLKKRFIAPPFSILDSKAGDWMERKRAWREKIGDDGTSRGDAAEVFESMSSLSEGKFADVSLLDPVLAEILVYWFMPDAVYGVNCFDCFAGDTVFGFVASSLGKKFTGIELREEQAEFNQSRCDEHMLNARYICDDGRNILQHIPKNSQDFFFSCPPYYDLEVYSDKPNDASNQETYEEFYAILDEAFTNAMECLKENRFAVVVASDVRDKKTGGYYDFISDIKKTFTNAGLSIYNEMILLNPIGTSALRANRLFRNRKVCRVHQEVIVFYKGDQKNIPDYFGEIEVGEIDGSEDEQVEWLDD